MAAPHPDRCTVCFFSISRAEIAWNSLEEPGGHIGLEPDKARAPKDPPAEDNEIPINVVVDGITHEYFPNVIEGDLYMRMKYETAFKIYDHGPTHANVPWPLLVLSPRESLNMMDPLDFRLDQFAENKVHELFGISFLEFIALPRYDLLKILDSAKKHSERLLKTGNADFKKLEQLVFQQKRQS